MLQSLMSTTAPDRTYRSRDTFRLTAAQAKGNVLLGGKARHVCLVGGSRSGKTSLIVRRTIQRALAADGSRHLVARFRGNAVRASVLADTFPKVMRLAFPEVKWAKRQEGYVEVGDGDSQIWFAGLDEGERTEKILGMEFATIFPGECSQIPYSTVLVLRTRMAQVVKLNNGKGFLPIRGFYDLNPTSKAHWTNVEFGDKRNPIDNTTLLDPDNYARMFINPVDNRENLSPEYIKMLAGMPKQYRERFFEGKYVDQIQGALWTVDVLELCRRDKIEPDPAGKKLGDFTRIAVAVDPSGAKSKFDVKSDDIGICAVGKRRSNRAVVLEDATTKGSPKEWGRAAVACYKRWKADVIVAEANYGGEMVRSTIQAVDGNVPVKLVSASRGKVVRAEPVSALFDEEKVELAGHFPALEDQMLLFSREGYEGEKSPDRADAMIWGVTELMLGEMSTYTLANIR